MLALFPLDVVLFPGAPLPLHIFEPRYKEMIGECLEAKSPFGLVRAHDDSNAVAGIGCSAEILNVIKRYDDGRLDILTTGRRRFEVLELDQERAFLRAEVMFFDDDAEPGAGQGSDAGISARAQAEALHRQMMTILGAS